MKTELQEVTVKQAAELADVDVKTIRNWIDCGYIRARKLPGVTTPYLIERSSLLAYLEKKNAGAN